MKKLQTVFYQPGYQFTQLWRDEWFSIYEKRCIATNQVLSIEAFQINKAPEGVAWFDDIQVRYQAKESYPTAEDFGHTAFSCKTLECANDVISTLRMGGLPVVYDALREANEVLQIRSLKQ